MLMELIILFRKVVWWIRRRIMLDMEVDIQIQAHMHNGLLFMQKYDFPSLLAYFPSSYLENMKRKKFMLYPICKD